MDSKRIENRPQKQGAKYRKAQGNNTCPEIHPGKKTVGGEKKKNCAVCGGQTRPARKVEALELKMENTASARPAALFWRCNEGLIGGKKKRSTFSILGKPPRGKQPRECPSIGTQQR